MEYQQAQVRPARLTRVNWTQTTTILIAAFVGCLTAFALVALAYKYKVGQALRAQSAKLDQVQREIDQANEDLRDIIDSTAQLDERYRRMTQARTAELTRSDPGREKPAKTAPVTYAESIPDEEPQKEENDSDKPLTGTPVETIPTV